MQCTKCGTTEADNWVTESVSRIVDTKQKHLHTITHEKHTVYFCPKCYEEEAINAI